MTHKLSETQLKHMKMAHFYTFDGTWRTAEPSWRHLEVVKENVRGCPSHGMTLNDPSALNSLQPGRRAKPAVAPPQRVPGDPDAAAAAAATFAALNFKDLKLSGFANETQCHTDFYYNEPERWGRLGIMTRERLVSSDRFGDIALPRARPITAPVGLRPATYPKQGAICLLYTSPSPRDS